MFGRLFSLKLGTRIILVTLTILVIIVALNYWVFMTRYAKSAQHAMVEKAAAFTAVADEAKNHASKVSASGALDTESLLADLAAVQEAGRSYKDAKIFNTIPVVAGWTAAQEAAERENIEFRISAFEARNLDNEPDPGSFEADLLTKLRQQVEARGDEYAYGVDEATNSLHYMRAIRLEQSCMMCHGKPGNQYDTDNDGKDPVGFAMKSWSVGKMHGSYHVVMPLDSVDAQVASFLTNGLTWTVPVVVVGVVLFFRNRSTNLIFHRWPWGQILLA